MNLILNSNKIKVKDFESIIGLMAFCARAIPSGRAFLRRFYDVFSCMKTVLLSARGTPSSWQMFLKTFINNAQFPDPLAPAKMKSSR
jgi:hypothetical protein